MPRAIGRLLNLLLLGYLALFGGLLYWQGVAADGLVADPSLNGYRADALARQNVRGRILDRNGEPLALSEPSPQGRVRRYPYPPAAHITGYWSRRYGVSGLEAAYDRALNGEQGGGAAALRDRLLHRPVVGLDVVTTIDLRLQRATDEALGTGRGAAVALDLRTGDVLALASHPFADPNRIEQEGQQLSQGAPGDPLVNRVTSGLYAPGSTFKVVTYTAALVNGAVTPETVFEDPDNGIVVERTRIPDPNHPGRPRFSAVEALALSSNAAFAEIGVRLGGARIRDQAGLYGFGAPLPFDLPTLPSEVARDPNFLRSQLGAATTAIGQGQLLATPLQMAQVAAAVGNGGQALKPRLVAEVRSPEGRVVARSAPEPLARVASPEIARQVAEGMALAVRISPAQTAALPNVAVAGKSGTAEFGESGVSHAWFIAFAPLEAPRVAVAVIEEGAGGGSTFAGPVARRMLEVGLQLTAP
jgi:peptidoglycan glycosyltransferase